MNDSENIIVKAFLAALTEQEFPLSDELQVKLSEISQSLDARVADLHYIAEGNDSLKIPYQNARSLLTNNAAERKQTLDILPSQDPEDSDLTEVPNIIRDGRTNLGKMEQVLTAINNRYNPDQASLILSASNSVESAKKQFLIN